MKSNSKTAPVKSMKAGRKGNYSAAADAIKNKLSEIRQDHHSCKAHTPSLALFGENPFRSLPPASPATQHMHAKMLRARVSNQLRLF